MGTFKHPARSVWHTSVCSRCKRVIQRVLLPGLQKRTTHRVCDRCLSEGSQAQGQAAAAAAPAAGGRRPRGRGGRRPATQAAPAAAE
ncbi:MAG: hypothetical protein OXC99_08015 [Chloroflexi bacterium]|nr:hypothetical protein [Chloroflexota bacterium]